MSASESEAKHDHETDCLPCSSGSFADLGASECTTCGAGSYQATSASAVCFPCPSGRYLPFTTDPEGHDGVSDCLLCEAGTYAVERSEVCTLCPGGKFVEHAGRGACDNCTAGKIAPSGGGPEAHDDGADDCVFCDAGMYWKSVATCGTCTSGTFQPYSNSMPFASCVDCPSGKELSDDGVDSTLHDSDDDCATCPSETFFFFFFSFLLRAQ